MDKIACPGHTDQRKAAFDSKIYLESSESDLHSQGDQALDSVWIE